MRRFDVERLEDRCLLDAGGLSVGAVFIEQDLGTDSHGDTLEVTFRGGAPQTQLTRLVIDGDQLSAGFGAGDVFFDTLEATDSANNGGFGADHAFPLTVQSQGNIHDVRWSVQDGTTRLVLEFAGFFADDKLVFSVDVDEAEEYSPRETDLDIVNEGFDPITSGVEFQGSLLVASFSAPDYHDASVTSEFRNRYDDNLAGTGLNLSPDNVDGKRDRTAGAVGHLVQQVRSATISGYVYEDQSSEGDRDPSEPGIPNVRIRIIPVTTIVPQSEVSVTTDAEGFYEASGLAPGTYRIVQPQQPTGYLDGLDRAGTVDGVTVGNAVNPGDEIGQVTLRGGQAGIEYNFGELRAVAIRGRVHLSTREGDCFDETVDHQPVSGALVQLLDGQGALLEETVTSQLGEYQFTGLPPGAYSVLEITPAGLFEGGARVGTVDGVLRGDLAGTSEIVGIQLSSGQVGVNYDFCEHPPATLAGAVYHDRSNDGVRNEGEQPIAGVSVVLLDQFDSEVASATTDAAGQYTFAALAAGTYRVVQQQPIGWLDGIDTAGTVNGRIVGQAFNPGDEIRAIQLGWGEQGVDYNFGELLPGIVEGIVHSDPNRDCVFGDDEEPIAGVRMELLDTTGSVIAATQTDAEGRYRFENIAPGTYGIREIQPDSFFQGGQRAGSGGGDDSTTDVISDIRIGSGEHLVDYNFCEVPPSEISGFVFQDGPAINLSLGQSLPDDLSEVQDGQLTPDDVPLSGVVLQLRDGISGTPIDASAALTGLYADGPIQTVTDPGGYYHFTGLPRGNYAVFEVQPDGYTDGIDTPGTTLGVAINRGVRVSTLVLESLQVDHQFDAIVRIALPPGISSQENNFSELLVNNTPLPPPAPPPPTPLKPPVTPEPFVETLVARQLAPLPEPEDRPLSPLPGRVRGYTWHLSVTNGGQPGGPAHALMESGPVWFSSTELHATMWSSTRMRGGQWMLLDDNDGVTQRLSFGVVGAIPVAGDFDGDGVSEIGVFTKGTWYIDLNGNGVWDHDDLWAKLGHDGDLPITGDWDGDGKDDIGIFGPAWPGDPRAIQLEPGLPDLENASTGEQKNTPLPVPDAPHGARYMKLTASGPTRADLIDHVFHFGTGGDIPVAGDWNGDGIDSIGAFRDGQWHLDTDGDGRWSNADQVLHYGQHGDQPVVGDFDGNGIDEIGIYRRGMFYLDSNRNGQLDARDKVLATDTPHGKPVAGDFNGDGIDQVGAYQDAQQPAEREARRNDELRMEN